MRLFRNNMLPKNSQDNLIKRLIPIGSLNRIETMWLNTDELPLESNLIYGLKGTGKTTLIDSALSKETLSKLAKEKVLVKKCHFISGLLRTDADVFSSLLSFVKDSIGILKGTDDYNLLLGIIENVKNDPKYSTYTDEKTRRLDILEECLRKLRLQGYCITLVIEDFHTLTCAKNLAIDTFNNLAYLNVQQFLSYIVLSDFHIKIGSDNYGLSDFERIFNNEPICTVGIKPQLFGLLRNNIKIRLGEILDIEDVSEQDRFSFTDEEINAIFSLTGGIPGLIAASLDELYSFKIQNPQRSAPIEALARTGCRDIFSEWLSHMNDGHKKVLQLILLTGFHLNEFESAITTQDLDTYCNQLVSMGLLRYDYQHNGERQIRAICELFEKDLTDRFPTGGSALGFNNNRRNVGGQYNM